MSRSLDELKTLFESKGITDALDDVRELIAAEKQIGIDSKRSANKEAEGLRKFKKALESIGFNGEDLDGYTAELKEKLEKSKDAKPLTEYQALAKQVSELTATINGEREKTRQATEKAARSALESKLTESLGGKVIGSKFVIDNVISSKVATIRDDGSVFWNIGGEELDNAKGIERFLKDNPDIVKSSQHGGAGSSGQSGNGQKTISTAVFDTLSVKEQAAKLQAGFTLTD